MLARRQGLRPGIQAVNRFLWPQVNHLTIGTRDGGRPRVCISVINPAVAGVLTDVVTEKCLGAT